MRLIMFSIGCLLFATLVAIPVYLVNFAAPYFGPPALEPEVVVQRDAITPSVTPPPAPTATAQASPPPPTATASPSPTTVETATATPSPAATATATLASAATSTPATTQAGAPTQSPTMTPSPAESATLATTLAATPLAALTAAGAITASRSLTGGLILLPTPTPATSQTLTGPFTSTLLGSQIITPTASAAQPATDATSVPTPTPTDTATAPPTATATQTPEVTVTPTPAFAPTASPTPTPSPTEASAATANPQISANLVSGRLDYQEKHYIPLVNIDSNLPITVDMEVSPPNHPAAGAALTVYIVSADDWRQITTNGIHPQLAHREVGRLEGALGHIRASISQPSPPYYLIVVNDDQQPAEYTLSVTNGSFAGQ